MSFSSGSEKSFSSVSESSASGSSASSDSSGSLSGSGSGSGSGSSGYSYWSIQNVGIAEGSPWGGSFSIVNSGTLDVEIIDIYTENGCDILGITLPVTIAPGNSVTVYVARPASGPDAYTPLDGELVTVVSSQDSASFIF